MTLKEKAVLLGIKVDGRWNDARIEAEIEKHNGYFGKPHELVSGTDETDVDVYVDTEGEVIKMNDLARRIYEGQSSSLKPSIRKERIIQRLINKGYEDLLDKLDYE